MKRDGFVLLPAFGLLLPVCSLLGAAAQDVSKTSPETVTLAVLESRVQVVFSKSAKIARLYPEHYQESVNSQAAWVRENLPCLFLSLEGFEILAPALGPVLTRRTGEAWTEALDKQGQPTELFGYPLAAGDSSGLLIGVSGREKAVIAFDREGKLRRVGLYDQLVALEAEFLALKGSAIYKLSTIGESKVVDLDTTLVGSAGKEILAGIAERRSTLLGNGDGRIWFREGNRLLGVSMHPDRAGNAPVEELRLAGRFRASLATASGLWFVEELDNRCILRFLGTRRDTQIGLPSNRYVRIKSAGNGVVFLCSEESQGEPVKVVAMRRTAAGLSACEPLTVDDAHGIDSIGVVEDKIVFLDRACSVGVLWLP